SFGRYRDRCYLHPLPTRRSSDLSVRRRSGSGQLAAVVGQLEGLLGVAAGEVGGAVADVGDDRVALRLDGGALGRLVVGDVLEQRSEEHTSELSHVKSSYAVFCLT